MFAGSQTFTMGLATSQDASPGQDKKVRQEEKMTCLPVTIRAVEVAVARSADEGGDVLFYGTEPGMLILVGLVETLIQQGSGFELTVNDGTGRMKVKHFTSDSVPGLEAGRYVSMYGHVRTAPTVHFGATGVRVVQSANDVSYHMIESAHSALKLQQRAKPDPSTPAPRTSAKDDVQPMDITPPKMLDMPAITPQKDVSSGTGLRATIIAILKEAEGKEEGVGFDELCGKLPTSSKDEARAVLQGLMDAGDAMTTIDDDHYSIV